MPKVGRPRKHNEAERAAKHREAMALRSREQTAAVSDIGELPEVADPARKEACRGDLKRFLTTYFPNSTGKRPFSPDHDRVIGRLQRCILEGGLFINAVYRGFAKTTISENAAIWAALYGYRKFVPLFGAESSAAEANIESIKLELAENDLLYADFPEVCHAIRALEGKPQRCGSQTYKREMTHIEWRADVIVLPTIPGSPAGGAIITAQGIEGASRGMKHKRPDGTQQRPDFVILDDPQTDGSASTPLQVNKRLDRIRKTILKLGGHDRRIACICNATVIRSDDLVEQLLNPKKFPAWQGERIKMVRKFANEHENLWLGEYQRLRNSYDRDTLGDQQRAHREATEFYREHRAEMDAGCEVSWEHCYDETHEISAIQHAYNLLIDDGADVFASECQNEPIRVDAEADFAGLKADEIIERVNRCPRGAVPAEASHLVVFIDVQKPILYWMAAAFGDGFGGGIVDYGTYPDQKRRYFHANDAKVTLQSLMPGKRLEEQIYAGLDSLTANLMAREWKREGGGTVLRPERILIDANYGDSTDTVYTFCQRSPHAAILAPAHGRFYGAKSARRINEGKPKPGERRGWGWNMPVAANRFVRYVIADVNAWKTRMMGLLKVPLGGSGCVTLFGEESEREHHRLVADHFCAEIPVKVEANGRVVTEWVHRPHKPDNHWWDCFVGCGVAASIAGVTITDKPEIRKVTRVKLSEIQKQKAQAR